MSEAATSRSVRLPLFALALLALSVPLFPYVVRRIFLFTPIEAQMGTAQKIFYFHVPSAWIMLLSAPLMAVAAIGYLVTKKDKWDRLSDASVELAIVFGLLVIISGPLWGRKAWGVYWVWDVRLTSSLVMILTLIACKIVRVYAGPSAKQIAAGLAVFAVLNAIFVYVSVDIWRGNHPPKLVNKKDGLAPTMKHAFWTCVLAFHVAYAAMLWARLRLGKLRSALDRLHMKATEAGLDD